MDGPAPNVNSLTINSGKTLTGQGYKITCDGESSANVVINNDGNIAGNLDLEINTQTATSAVFGGSSGNCFRDVKLNHANVDLHLLGNAFIDGDLTIAAGQLTCATEAGSARDLTVEGHVSLTGTLNGSAAAISLGSLTINSGGTYSATTGTTTITGESGGGYALENLGTFTHNKGKVLIDFDTSNKNDNTNVKCNEFYDFEIKMNGASYSTIFRDLSGDTVTFLGDLTITKGKFDDNVNSDTYIIHGNTILESEGSFGVSTGWHTGDITHHGLVVIKGNYYRSNAGGTVKMGGIRNIGGSIL